MEQVEKLIGKRISEARCSRGRPQEELAEKCCLSVSTISRIETGHNSTPIKTLLSLCSSLNVGLDYVLYDLMPQNQDSQPSPQIQEILFLLESLKEPELHFVHDFLTVYTLYRSKL